MESISICIFSAELGKREIEKSFLVAGIRIACIGLGAEIPRVPAKLSPLQHINSASYKLGSGVYLPGFFFLGFCEFLKFLQCDDLQAERHPSSFVHVVPGSAPDSPFGSDREASLRVPSVSKGHAARHSGCG